MPLNKAESSSSWSCASAKVVWPLHRSERQYGAKHLKHCNIPKEHNGNVVATTEEHSNDFVKEKKGKRKQHR